MKTFPGKKNDDLELDQAIEEFVAAVIISNQSKITVDRYNKMHYYISPQTQEKLKKLVIGNPNVEDTILD